MGLVAFLLAGVLLSNHQGVKERAAEVDRVQKDLVELAEDIQQLSRLEKERAFSTVEHERLARDRLHWTAPGEYIVRIADPSEDLF